MPAHSRESLIKAVIRLGKRTKGRICLREFCRAERMSCQPIYRHFPRGFGELLAAANLQDRVARPGRVTKEDLLAELDTIVSELRRMPTRMELARKARYSPPTFARHLGSWKDIAEAYAQWKALPGRLSTIPPTALQSSPARASGRAAITCTHKAVRRGQRPAAPPDGFRGAPLGFRGLLHAPTHESGVIHLFGLLSPELGIAVESIGPTYPDCIAVRADPSGRWRRIAIEFEYKSANFRDHRHNPAKCDLIVCWEHDWPDCPLEVLELKTVLERLTDK
jgi:hypothetical protein